MWFTFIGSWFTCLVQCYCLTVYHDLQLPGRLEIILRIRTGPTGRFSYRPSVILTPKSRTICLQVQSTGT